MKKYSLLAIALVLLAASALWAQGAGQPPRIDWNARAPWGAQPNLPFDQQKKDPFKIFDNVWYVGIQTAAPYLVMTSDGLVLFDATWDETADYVLDNIRKAGFNPRDIKYLIVTHAHIDHFAGTERIRKATGARVAMSLEDWKETERVQAIPGDGRQNPGPKITRDLVVEDGQTLKLGDQTFKFYVTPGHTPGATSTEFQARDGNRRYRVIVPGGLGIPTAEWSQAYLKSTERLKSLGPWDVMLPNHSDMMVPKKWKDLEADLKAYKPGVGPHPAVAGAARLNTWFDAIITLMHEKIAMERTAAPASR